MTQYFEVNTKLTKSQLNKLKAATKDNTDVTLRLSTNMFGTDENVYPHKLLLTKTQAEKLKKSEGAADIKFSKTQIKKLAQSGGFLGKLLGPLLKFAVPLAKNVLLPLGLTAAASATDAGIQKSIRGSGATTTLIISNKDLDDIKKIIKCLEEQGILVKGVKDMIENEVKEQKGGFLGMLLGTLGASLLGNMLTGKGIVRAGEGVIRAGEDF